MHILRLLVNNPNYYACYDVFVNIEEHKITDTDIRIYPNPVHDNFTIKSNSYNANVKIYNINGKLLYNKTLNQDSKTIDMNLNYSFYS